MILTVLNGMKRKGRFLMGDVFEFEDKKILYDTIKKILYGIEFDELPPAKILRSIEEDYEIVLEFKNHFRYLVPQVYGWEFMDEYMYHESPFPRKPNEQPERRECIEERACLRPKELGMTYYDFCHCVAEANARHHQRETDEYVWQNKCSTEKAASLCEELFYSIRFMGDEIEKEEEYWEKQSKQNAVLDEMYSQLEKYLGDYDTLDRKMYFGIMSGEFVDNFINNKLMKCKDTLSGEDSGLNNFWEEYCVQVQQEHSFFWQTYLDQLDFWIEEEFEKLPMWQRNAIWLDLIHEDISDYFDAEYDPDESEDKGYLFIEDDTKNVDIENKKSYDLNEVIDLINQRVTDKAADFTNKAIERYLFGDSYSHFDDSDDEND